MTKPFIQDLVNDMTLDEKLAQLTQLMIIQLLSTNRHQFI